MNAVEIEEAVSSLAEAPLDFEEFRYAFLEAFGNKSTTLKRLHFWGLGGRPWDPPRPLPRPTLPEGG